MGTSLVGAGSSLDCGFLSLHFLGAKTHRRTGKRERQRDHRPLRQVPTEHSLTCRALLAPLSTAQAIGGVVSPRRTRIKTDPSFLRAVEPRRAAVPEPFRAVKPSRTREAFVLTCEGKMGIKRKHGTKWKENTTCTTSLCLVVHLEKQKLK